MKNILLFTIVLTTILLSSCKKDSMSDPTDLSGTEWKSLDVDPQYEEYILLKFKSKTTVELWYKDKGDPIYMDSEGIYSISGKSITMNFGNGADTGAIDGNVINFSESGTIIRFTKQ